jgi:hypothetical protein
MRSFGSSARLWALVVSLLTLAFAAGMAAGVAGDRLIGSRLRVKIVRDDMSRVFDRLDLTTDQRRVAESIVQRSAPRSRAILMEAAERLRAVSDSVDAELRAILTSEQRLRLDSLRRESRLLLKVKTATSGATSVDTILDTSVGTPRQR